MTSSLGDSFSILQLASTATEAEIKKAYRKLSLKFHPDKVGKDVDPTLAATRFHQLNLAYETLMDPAARAKAAQSSKQQQEKRERQQEYQGKRKAMADELERQEREASRKKQQQSELERERVRELQELKERGRKMREQRQKEVEDRHSAAAATPSQTAASHAAAAAAPSSLDGNGGPSYSGSEFSAAASSRTSSAQPRAPQPPSLGPLDLTTRLRFPATHFHYLVGQAPSPSSSPPEDLAALTAPVDPSATPLYRALATTFGPLQDLRFQLPDPTKAQKSKKRRPKSELTAFATFESFQHAWKAVEVGGRLACPGEVLEDVWIGWAGAKGSGKDAEANHEASDAANGEPERVGWYRASGIHSATDLPRETGPSSSLGSTFLGTDSASSAGVGAAAAATAAPSAAVPRFSFNGAARSAYGCGAADPSGDGTAIDLEYESATLQRLREAERRRMEEAIRSADAEEA